MAKCIECGSSTKKYGTTVRRIDCIENGVPANVQLKVKRTRCVDKICQNIDYIYPEKYEKSDIGMYTKEYIQYVRDYHKESKKTPYMVAQEIGKSYGTVKRILGITK